jgi:hypothetical protein
METKDELKNFYLIKRVGTKFYPPFKYRVIMRGSLLECFTVLTEKEALRCSAVDYVYEVISVSLFDTIVLAQDQTEPIIAV